VQCASGQTSVALCPTVHADCRQDREGQGPNKLRDAACTLAAIALRLSGAYEASCVDRLGLGLVRGQGTKAAALHCCKALLPFGQFAPLPSDVQIHLPKCGVRSRKSESLAFRHLSPAPFCPFTHSVRTDELLHRSLFAETGRSSPF
jgi:hypothetical protein